MSMQVAVVLGAVAEAHAVEARQVRRRLGRRDDVVDRDRQLGARQAARRPASRRACSNSASAARSGAVDVAGQRRREEFLRQADAQALQRPRRRRAGAPWRARRGSPAAAARRWSSRAGRSPLIAAEQQRAVLGAARQQAGLVEARGEGDHAVARAHAVGRLDAGDAAKARRLADRAAGVGAGRRRQQARRDRRRRAARRAARDARSRPRGCA